MWVNAAGIRWNEHVLIWEGLADEPSGDVVTPEDLVGTWHEVFSAGKIQATLLSGSFYYNSGATRYLGNYAAAVKVEEPADPEEGGDPIAGEWNVTCTLEPAFGGAATEKTGKMVISGSNGSYVIETIAGETFNLSVTFADNVLKGSKNGATLKLIYDPTNKTLTHDGNAFQTWELPTVKSQVATK